MVSGPWAGVAAGLAGVALVTLGVELASDRIDVLAMAVVYQLLVLVVSAAWGLGAGLSTGVASVLAINWFFVPPTGTLTIDDSRGWISLAVFAVTAVITSRLTAEARSRRRESETRRREAEQLVGPRADRARGDRPGAARPRGRRRGRPRPGRGALRARPRPRRARRPRAARRPA